MKRIRRPRDTKEIVAFWWEIYRALVMNSRLLGGVGGEDIKDVFKDKRKTFYEPWGDVTNETKFEAWWKLHRDMFIEEAAIQEVPQRNDYSVFHSPVCVDQSQEATLETDI